MSKSLILLALLPVLTAAPPGSCSSINIPVQWTMMSSYPPGGSPAAITGVGAPYGNARKVEAVISDCSGSNDATLLLNGTGRSIYFDFTKPLTSGSPQPGLVRGTLLNIRTVMFVPEGADRSQECTFTARLGSVSSAGNLAMLSPSAVAPTVGDGSKIDTANSPYPNSRVIEDSSNDELQLRRASSPTSGIALEPVYHQGVLQLEQERFVEAEASFRRGAQLCRTASPGDCGVFLGGLGAVHFQLGQFHLAETELRDARALIIASHGPDSLTELDTVSTLAQLLRERGEAARALPIARRALQIGNRHLPAGSPVLLRLHSIAILTAVEAGELALARSLLAAAISAVGQSNKPLLPIQLGFPLTQAAVFRATGERAEAIRIAEHGLTKASESLGPDHALLADYLRVLAELYSDENRHLDAVRAITSALAIDEANLGSGNPRLVPTLKVYEQTLRRARRKAEATAINGRVRVLASGLQADSR